MEGKIILQGTQELYLSLYLHTVSPEQISWLALPWLSRNFCLKFIYIAFYRLELCKIEFDKGDKKLFLKKARAQRVIYEFFTIRLRGIKAYI